MTMTIPENTNAPDFRAENAQNPTPPVAEAVADLVAAEELLTRISDAICENYQKDGDGYYDTPLTYLLRDAASTVARLQQEIQRLKAELAAVKEMYAREGAKALYELERAERAEAQLAEANKALEPFAMVAEHDISEDEADSDPFRPMPKPFNHAPRITVGHIRAALRALTGGQEDG